MDATVGSIQKTSYVDSEIRIVLLGKTGVGKSTLGNLLVGEKVFKSEPLFWSCTKMCHQAMFKYEGQAIQIVDTPGFSDTKMDEKDLNTELGKCLALTSPGIHAVLYTIRIGRFTKEDQQVLDKFLNMFGKDIIDHVIIIFTGKDDLDRSGVSFEDMKGDDNFDPGLKKVLDDCKERYVVLCAVKEDSRDEYMQEILTKTKQLTEANGGRYYTNEMFLAVEIELLKLENKKMNELIAKQTEHFEKKMLEMETIIRLKGTKPPIDEAEEKNKDEKLKKEEAQMKERSRREIREDVIIGCQAIAGLLGIIVGDEGSKIARTVAVGGVAGAALGAAVGGYLSLKADEASVQTSTVPAITGVTKPSQTSGDQTDTANVNKGVS